MKKIFIIILFFYTITLFSSISIVKGVIKNEKNKPLSEVNIYLKNQSKLGTVSNIDGEFKLDIDNSLNLQDTLIFSYMGYNPYKLPLSKVEDIYYNIKMTTKSFNLKKVVIESEKVPLKLEIDYLSSVPIVDYSVSDDKKITAILYENSIIKLLNKKMKVFKTIILKSSNKYFYKQLKISSNSCYLSVISDRTLTIFNIKTGESCYEYVFNEKIDTMLFLDNYLLCRIGNKIKAIRYLKDKLRYEKYNIFPYIIPYGKDVRLNPKNKKTKYSKPQYTAIEYNNSLYLIFLDNYFTLKIYKNKELIFSHKIKEIPDCFDFNPASNELFIINGKSINMYVIKSSSKMVKVDQLSFNNILLSYKLNQLKESKNFIKTFFNNIFKFKMPYKLCKVINNSLYYVDKSNKLFSFSLNSLNNNVQNLFYKKIYFKNYKHIINTKDSVIFLKNSFQVDKYMLGRIISTKKIKSEINTQNGNFVFKNSALQIYISPDSKISFLKDDIRNPNRPITSNMLKWQFGSRELPIVNVNRYAINYKDKNYLIKGTIYKQLKTLSLKFKIQDTEKDDYYQILKYNKKSTGRKINAFSNFDITSTKHKNLIVAFSLNNNKTVILRNLNFEDSVTLNINKLPEYIDNSAKDTLLLSSNGKYLALSDFSSETEIYDLTQKTKTPYLTLDHDDIKFSKFIGEKYFLVFNEDKECFIYDLNNINNTPKTMNLSYSPQQIKDIYYNEALNRFDCLVQDGSLVSFDINNNKKWYKKLFLENGKRIIMDNNDNFACDKGEKDNIYFVEKNKIIRDSVLINHFYKPELMGKF